MNNLMTKSFLSYADLKKQAQLDVQVDLSEAEPGEIRPTNQENLSLFFQEVEAIKSQMEEISDLLHDLQSLNEDAKSTHSAKIRRGLRDRMDSDTVSILRKVKSLKSKLDSLDKSSTKSRTMSVAFREGSAVDRTRVAVSNGLRVKFKDIVHGFTCLREKIMLDQKAFLTRKYFNVTGVMPSEETVDKLMSGSIKVMALEVEDKERNEVMKDIERSLNKLHQVFLDMAVLIEKQGDQVDDIEQNVAKAGGILHFVSLLHFIANLELVECSSYVHWGFS
ncbi:hypothetical protein Cgig2_009577 [Carnegiea gigantea]|uniref:t-SNARE coiled-coil homology domain-containing protein n=1 Tax=Carnegiea gigantea TaxID=171969 RepID=A0A9Q1QET9_9CARY|nr:hypothetical protein Cgig2_009577 [Carnegiea gigantea]